MPRREGGELLSSPRLLRNAGGASGHRAGGIVDGVTVGAGGGAAAAVALVSAVAVENFAVLQAVLSGGRRSGGNAGNGRASHRVSPAAFSSTLQERPARHCQHLCGALSCGHQQCRTQFAAECGDKIVLLLFF